jgi:hypothetical protein
MINIKKRKVKLTFTIFKIVFFQKKLQVYIKISIILCMFVVDINY